MHELLPHLTQVAREARIAASITYAHIAIHVRKSDGRRGVAESTVHRFENARGWPENPDAMVEAYALATGQPVAEFWQRAAERLSRD
jgi:hypothetical protein